ncbi:SusC/RagA family TonB-linked outer membrane protein [Pedobacter sp. MC2016-14]|uniref:SusC/RagA family TonB-linked outer membrane protein n=1 Tax=Pedobacter sp. MC2016-14 TaxID=2897327 RepID=UPI001E5F8234|nr:SusC/RagA family TonB-linked outer membrane protein [Pedobacter sp. MC2016-14]MCD0490567.1 SusC/RagA family TonB-linked outer membrane protein [Pedobacter sp. MC2016-14]
MILLIAFMQISFAANAQKISLFKKNALLTEVFRELKKQSGYGFMINREQVKMAKPVTINSNGDDLEKVLDKCFEGQPFTYKLEGKMIVVVDTKPEQVKTEKLNIDVKGRAFDEYGRPLVGATVVIKGTERRVTTNANGEFTFNNVDEKAILVISYVGYESREILASTDLSNIKLTVSTDKLEEVSVVSTGYQSIPKERATGAFTQIDNKTLNRNVGVNILDRLEGVTSGLILNRNLPTQGGANNSKISIRGRSTLFATPEPLIILDGFPYEGGIDQINPADVQSITVLKDAAAASIWGTRAGNGVIVITSKTGKKNQPLAIGVSSTLTVTDKPDLYYQPQISSSDYIDLEQFLYGKGYYTGTLSNVFSPVSSAVAILSKGQADATAQLNALKAHDVRADLERYAYRQAVYQQYQLNLSGGSENQWYYLSGGYDKNLENLITDSYDRLTLNARNTYALLKGRLKIFGDIGFNSSKTYSKADPYNPNTPYDRLADENGNALSVINISTLSDAYTDVAGNGKLLDWKYRPKDEFISNTLNQVMQYKINMGVDFEILKGLNLAGSYQYLRENSDSDRDYPLSSFYTRNLINRYSTITNNTVSRVIELGDILEQANTKTISKIGRVQLNFNKVIATDHEINAIAGFEGADTRSNYRTQTLYGYDPSTQLNNNGKINPLMSYPYFYDQSSSSQISTAPGAGGRINIAESFYTNASYSFKKRYILSGSARRDRSNLFGVNTNQKGVPLWSAGLAWIINSESFYNISWLPSLKLRGTYGYSGNVDKSVSGLLTARKIGLTNEWGSLYSDILNPPNPDLRWEKVKNWNVGIDYALKSNRINGSIDLYQKDAFDLIGNSPIAMQSGITQFRGNSADLRTKGIDVLLNSKNITGEFQWGSTVLFNYNTDKVTSYKAKQTSNNTIVRQNFNNPLEGYPYYAVYSFPSAGLDAIGAPQGYLNGTISKNYTAILNLLDPSQIIYHGSASPKYFGSLINTFNYRNFELSINLTYKFDYYFRRTKVFYGAFSNDYSVLGSYDQRWQSAGDELTTKIPALVYPEVPSLGTFFQNSSDLVERADQIRLQDIRLSYQLTGRLLSKLPFKSISAFSYVKNIGILWRKNDLDIDPDYGTSTNPQPLSVSFGINLNL